MTAAGHGPPWVAVVGAGPAGIMAARAALQGGCRVTLADEARHPGGQAGRRGHLLQAFGEIEARIDYRPETMARSLVPGTRLGLVNLGAAADGKSEELRPDAVVLATGLSETAVPFPGWTLPGVLSAGEVQAVMKASSAPPGARAVVAGSGPLPVLVAAQLLEVGVEVMAVALLHSFKALALDPRGLLSGRQLMREGFGALRRLRRAGVDVLTGWAPLGAEGSNRLERVLIAPHFGTGRPDPERSRTLDADLLVASHGFAANSELARMAGAEVQYFGPRGGWVPLADTYGRSSVPDLYIAGDCGGMAGPLAAAAEGTIVGSAAAADLLQIGQPDLAGALAGRSRHLRFQRALAPLFDLPPAVWEWSNAETAICRCENVTKGRIQEALAEGHRTLDRIGRETRAGTGRCGGRICLHAVAALAAGGKPASDTAPMVARPLAGPVTPGAVTKQ